MKTLKHIKNKVTASESLKKISEIFKEEFPYAHIKYAARKNKDGFYKVEMDVLKEEDFNKFISTLHSASHKHGIGAGIPISIRYKRLQ